MSKPTPQDEQAREAWVLKEYNRYNNSESDWNQLDIRGAWNNGFLAGIQAEREKDRWISVKERLPETQLCSVIALLGNGVITELHYSNFGYIHWFKVGIGDINIEDVVTHWQPLPEPPQNKP